MATVAERSQKRWTYEDYFKLDDGRRYEVIEGRLIPMSPAPRTWHQNWVGQIFARFYAFNQQRKLGWVGLSPIDVILDEDNTLQPDLCFVLNENKHLIEDRGVFGPPDLVVELISPSTKRRDLGVKRSLYERFGVREYWLGDPRERSMGISILRAGKYVRHSRVEDKGLVASVLLPGFTFDLGEIQ